MADPEGRWKVAKVTSAALSPITNGTYTRNFSVIMADVKLPISIAGTVL